jgi:hypothetical protein
MDESSCVHAGVGCCVMSGWGMRARARILSTEVGGRSGCDCCEKKEKEKKAEKLCSLSVVGWGTVAYKDPS